MHRSLQNNRDAVEFVTEVLNNSQTVSPLTMIITREKSGAFSVLTATEELSEDTVMDLMLTYYRLLGYT